MNEKEESLKTEEGVASHRTPKVSPRRAFPRERLVIGAAEAVERYYCEVEIAFSGKRGFHIHILDFDPHD